jgi:hypothetical protein
MPMPSDPATPPTPARTGLSAPCTATEVVIRWVGWHLIELTGTGVPLVLALSVSVWWALIAVLTGALWMVHEVRIARRHRALPPTIAHRVGPGHTDSIGHTETRKDASA